MKSVTRVYWSYLPSTTTTSIMVFRRGTWEMALSPPPKTTPQKFGSPPFPAGDEFMVRARKCGGHSHGLYTTEMYRGRTMLYALVGERNRDLPRTNNAGNAIQNEGDRRHWSEGSLNTTDRGAAEDCRYWPGNGTNGGQLNRLYSRSISRGRRGGENSTCTYISDE